MCGEFIFLECFLDFFLFCALIRNFVVLGRARGTAPDSVQRRNARALRVSNGVVQRVAAFLSSPMMFASKGCDGSRRILTECIIGMPMSVSLFYVQTMGVFCIFVERDVSLTHELFCIVFGTIIRRTLPPSPQ